MAAVSPPTPPQQQRCVVEVREGVELTEKEERIFRRLLDVVRHFGLGTQLRVAGGWVRDKVSSPPFPFFFLRKGGHISFSALSVEYMENSTRSSDCIKPFWRKKILGNLV